MRVVVLHSDVPADAAPDEIDTIVTAQAVAKALQNLGHSAVLAPFVPAPSVLLSILREAHADIVFNMVESVFGQGELAAVAPAMLEKHSIHFTGNGAASIALTGDKPLAKQILRSANLPTPDWAEAPRWDGLQDTTRYIVKSATEDASLGLDDESVLCGEEAIRSKALSCGKRFGGRWFAEAFIDGREFNVAMVEAKGAIEVLPIPEMCFEHWPARKARIVGYRAKWEEDSDESMKTVRKFGIEKEAPQLASRLADLARHAWRLFGLRGYARVDFRVDGAGQPAILEINANPALDPVAGFASAAAEAGYSFEDVIGLILEAAC